MKRLKCTCLLLTTLFCLSADSCFYYGIDTKRIAFEIDAIQYENELSTEQNAPRLFCFINTLSFALLIIMFIYLNMLRQDKKRAEMQIAALNNTVNVYVMAMEEAKYEAIKAEQQRLGQDLHDGLSAPIASIGYQLEVLAMDVREAQLKSRLNIIQEQVANIYEIVRNKSHEWFTISEEQRMQSFEQRIRAIVDSALPDSRYKKKIHVDDDSLLLISLEARIALLRITQEAITNIIKHAKAKSIDILIYEDMGNLIWTIKDDGRGLDKKNINPRSGIGLQSIRQRVYNLNGTIKIHSDTNGTEITVSIPYTQPVYP